MSNILIIDDSSFQRSMVKRMVTDGGHQITEAPGGAEALELLKEQSFDCIVCDLLMPVVSGFDVLTEMQKKNNTIPIIVLTADIQDSVKENCINLGAKIVLNKPPNKEILLGKISEFTNS